MFEVKEEISILFIIFLFSISFVLVYLSYSLWRHRIKLQSLEQENFRFKLMAQSAKIGFFECELKSGSFLFLSPEAQNLLKRKDNSECSLYDYIHPNHLFKIKETLKKGISSRGLVYEIPMEVQKGYYEWFLLFIDNIEVEKSGSVNGLLLNINDRVKASEKLEKLVEELHEFAYIASHDLREPLRGIQNYAQFLSEDYGDQIDREGKHYISSLINMSKRLDNYLVSLFNYTKMTNTKEMTEVFNLTDLVSESSNIYLDQSSIKVEISKEKLDCDLRADKVKLKVVLGNLIQNAIKYNDSEIKKVKISLVNLSSDEVLIDIEDNGVGIEEKNWDKVFLLFQRFHDNNTSGLGLGLSLVKKIVELNCGKIKVIKSQLGAGTTIRFSFKVY